MEMSELRILARDLDVHGAAKRTARRAADFRNFVFEPVGQPGLCARFRSGHWIADRFAGRLDIAWNQQATSPALDVNLEIDRREYGFVHRFDRRREYREHGSEWVSILAAHDLQQSLTLGRIGTLVDNRHRLSVAFVNRTRPFEHADNAQPA